MTGYTFETKLRFLYNFMDNTNFLITAVLRDHNPILEEWAK